LVQVTDGVQGRPLGWNEDIGGMARITMDSI